MIITTNEWKMLQENDFVIINRDGNNYLIREEKLTGELRAVLLAKDGIAEPVRSYHISVDTLNEFTIYKVINAVTGAGIAQTTNIDFAQEVVEDRPGYFVIPRYYYMYY